MSINVFVFYLVFFRRIDIDSVGYCFLPTYWIQEVQLHYIQFDLSLWDVELSRLMWLWLIGSMKEHSRSY